jgi:death-on-curing protein
MSPRFLSLIEVLQIHQDQVDRYGGSQGTRVLALLQSALAMPESGIGDHYLHSDLFEMAAAYLFHIIKDHPFLDGNKRVGVVAALVFLDLNRVELQMSDDELVQLALGVATGQVTKMGIADELRRHGRP